MRSLFMTFTKEATRLAKEGQLKEAITSLENACCCREAGKTRKVYLNRVQQFLYLELRAQEMRRD